MKIYNTLTRQKEEFVPIEAGKVSMYLCGPTVYNLIHVGNARPMVIFDTFRRYLEYKGYEVCYVSNFTDVDDKIINRALEEGVPASEISQRYIAECKKDMEALHVKPATVHPQATEEIGGMIDMIGTLLDKQYAYKAGGGTVYYRTRKFADYGKLSHKSIDDLESGHRAIKVSGDGKEDSLDFVLWKPKKEGEPFWASPWCDGRPGLHIECSCMSRRYLGDTIDIHAGGEDLIFPHHENEIAQSEAATGKPFARYWMHNAFLNIDGSKMSKSLGNFRTVRDVLERYDPQALRFFMLQAHYHSPLNFSAEMMDAAKSGLERIFTSARNLSFLLDRAGVDKTGKSETLPDEIKGFVKAFEDAMEDDLNTANAVSAVFELVKYINSNSGSEQPPAYLQTLYQTLAMLCDILGIELNQTADIDAEIEALIAEREAARKVKNYAKADAIRDELTAKGIILEDSREGVKWRRKSS